MQTKTRRPRAWAERDGNAIDEEIGDERGVEGAGADGDEVGALDGFAGFQASGAGSGGIEGEFDNAAVAGGDVGFAADNGTVVHSRDQGGVDGGDRIDAAAGGKNLRGKLDGLDKVAGDFSKSGQKEVAEVVSLESVAGAEAMVEEAGQQGLFFAEGDHAVAESPGGSMLKSLRRRPEEPPSSVTVTTAARSAIAPWGKVL